MNKEGQNPCPKISVVVPAFNERATLPEILRRVELVDINKEIIVVDDGSTDGTREFLLELQGATSDGPVTQLQDKPEHPPFTNDLRVFFQERNRGKGAALRRGFREARGELVVIQDADLEYDPQDYLKLIEPIERGLADVVYGSRFQGGPHRVLLFWHAVGNKLLTTLTNMFTNLNLSDVWTCYKVFKREALEKLDLRENRFGFEIEVTVKIAAAGCRVYEVPISYYGRTYAEGKKITWRDGLRGIWCVLRYTLFG